MIRALLVETLLPGQYRDLADQEMLYSACACTTIAAAGRGLFDLFTDALEGEPAADAALPLPAFLKNIRDKKPPLPFSLRCVWQQILQAILNSYNNFTSPFEPLWREHSLRPTARDYLRTDHTPSPPLGNHVARSAKQFSGNKLVAGLGSQKAGMRGIGQLADVKTALTAQQPDAEISSRPSLLEVACGSANDFRYFPRYGLDALIDYTGVDICATNVANAQRRCPTGTFREGNALALPFPDKSFDCYLMFDLFEHLSLAAVRQALREAVRVTRRKLWLS